MLKIIFLIFFLTPYSLQSDVFLKNTYNSFKNATINLKISLQCRNQLNRFVLGIDLMEQWALQLLEANGEILLQNEDNEKNSFDSCINTNETIGSEVLLGKYCVPAQKFESHLDWKKITLSTGVCVPDKCTVSDIVEIYDSPQNKFWTTDILCQTKEVEPYDSIAVGSITLFTILFSIVMASTLYDLTSYYLTDKPAHYLFTLFSLLTNGKKLLQTSKSESFEQISCLNGLRVISFISIIVHHAFLINLQFIKNMWYYNQWNSSIFGILVTGNGLSVNTFLVMTGLLISFNEMKSVSKKQQFHLMRHYINRYFRVSSVFFIVVLLHLSLIHLNSGPLWKAYAHFFRSNCSTYWWSTLLYIQTIINTDRLCVEHSWYLSLDMQLFFISPILLIPLRTRPKLVLIYAALLAFLSSISVFGVVWFYGGFTATIYPFKIYINILTRASPWFFGFILGYFLFTSKKSETHINKMWVGLFSLASVIAFIICLYINVINNFGSEYVLQNSIRISIVHPLWSCIVCWIIYACVNGHIDPINRFLSLPMFQILARLSYSAYIIHYSIMYHITYTSRKPIMFSAFEQMIWSIWYTMITIILSLLATLTIEMPVTTIANKILKKI